VGVLSFFTVPVDTILKIISDRGDIPRLLHGILLGTNTSFSATVLHPCEDISLSTARGLGPDRWPRPVKSL